MADFSSNDINDAKRRVEEMRNRARNYVDDSNSNHNNDSNINSKTNKDKKESNPPLLNNAFSGGMGDIFSRFSSNEDSSVILALILILSREKADNMLILALLYILL